MHSNTESSHLCSCHAEGEIRKKGLVAGGHHPPHHTSARGRGEEGVKVDLFEERKGYSSDKWAQSSGFFCMLLGAEAKQAND